MVEGLWYRVIYASTAHIEITSLSLCFVSAYIAMWRGPGFTIKTPPTISGSLEIRRDRTTEVHFSLAITSVSGWSTEPPSETLNLASAKKLGGL